MKRRDVLKLYSCGMLCAGINGCSLVRPVKINLRPEGVPFSFGDNYPKPQGGTIPKKELGRTGIMVSALGFGSHMRMPLVPYERERERILRDAFEYGVNLYDVYDIEGGKIYQYEPTGRHLAPVINDVLISINLSPYGGRSPEEELHRDLRLFGKDSIDLVRIHAWAPDDPKFGEIWWMWDELFRFKEQGKIRAVGVPVHSWKDLKKPLETYPLDFVMIPYNFYHNIAFGAAQAERETPDGGFDDVAKLLKEKGVGVITMKPLGGDFLITPFIKAAGMYAKEKELSVPQAALRYVINSGINADSTLAGMYYPSHVYENVDAFLHPSISPEERRLLNTLKKAARMNAASWLPDHYRFLDHWAPELEVHDTSTPV